MKKVSLKDQHRGGIVTAEKSKPVFQGLVSLRKQKDLVKPRERLPFR